MKVVFTSDIHCDIAHQNHELLHHLVDAVRRESPDVFVVAGDVANDLEGLERALSLMSAAPCRKLFVSGNHDLWVSKSAARKGKDSWWRYTSLIPEMCRKHDFECIATNPVVIDGVGFVGSVGWYDFSLRDPRLDEVYSALDYERGEFFDGRFPTGVWSDARYARWLHDPNAADWRRRGIRSTTPETFDRVLDLFRAKVSEIADRAEKLIAVIHTAPFGACVEKRDTPDPFEAYGGSERLGELLVALSASKQVYCLTGHQHHPLDVVVEGIRVIRSPVGYLNRFRGDLAEKAAETLGVLQL